MARAQESELNAAQSQPLPEGALLWQRVRACACAHSAGFNRCFRVRMLVCVYMWLQVLVGHPDYEVTGGTATYKGVDLFELEPEQRSHMGLFLRSACMPECVFCTVSGRMMQARMLGRSCLAGMSGRACTACHPRHTSLPAGKCCDC